MTPVSVPTAKRVPSRDTIPAAMVTSRLARAARYRSVQSQGTGSRTLAFEGRIIRVIEGLPSPRGRWRRGAGYHGLAFTSRWRPGAGNHRLAASTPTASSTMVGTWFITRVLGSVQEAGAALVELLAAVTAAEPAIALRGALRPMPDGR